MYCTASGDCFSKLAYRSKARHHRAEHPNEKREVADFPYLFKAMDDEHQTGQLPQRYKGGISTQGTQIRPWLFGNWWRTSEAPFQLVGFGVRLGSGPHLKDALGNQKKKLHLRGTPFRLRISSGQQDSGVRNFIPGRELDVDTSLANRLPMIKAWLNACDKRHQCVSQNDIVLPTRVLNVKSLSPLEELVPSEISKTISIKLVETHGEKGRYCALSHCWGKYYMYTIT